MKLKTVIFMFWILTGMWTKSVVQGITFCSYRIAQFNEREISVRIERRNCNNETSTEPRTPTVTQSISCSNFDTCDSVFHFLQTCPNTREVRRNADSIQYSITNWCQSCPSSVTVLPISRNVRSTSPTHEPTSSSPTSRSTSPTHGPTSSSPTSRSTSPTHGPTSSSPTSDTDSEVLSQISQVIDERDSLKIIVTALGVLVGILVTLLIVVTSGWVWTCWTMKRNKATTPEHVRTTQNTAYGVIGPVGNSEREDQTSSGHQQGQTDDDYQIMNEEKEDHGEEHDYHVLEGSGETTHPQQNRELEMRQMRGSGEEHAYHVLEGPGGGNASREPRVRGVGGTMDYEIPLPLRK